MAGLGWYPCSWLQPRYLTSVTSSTKALAFVRINILKFSFAEIARDLSEPHRCYGSETSYQWKVKSR